ncbi:MAG: exodeoxyribonuclease III [Bacteroidetes bacterium]|nr:exodeoxyribonuclease III [Bacteroidota bacterium]
MRIISYNVNGIRAAIKKGLLEWLTEDVADIICLQEIKATQENVDIEKIQSLGFHTYWFSAEKKGYSGVAVFTKQKPLQVFYGHAQNQSDLEGRLIRLDFKKFILINAYFPSGTSGELRQNYKYEWLDGFKSYIEKLQKENKKVVVCGDYNIAHKEIDIHDPKGNKKSSGFLPAERDWMDHFFQTGFTDSFRHLHPEDAGFYSWWSQRSPTVRAENKGWRIDYISITDNLRKLLKSAALYPDIKHSDHCPVFIEIDL